MTNRINIDGHCVLAECGMVFFACKMLSVFGLLGWAIGFAFLSHH